MCGIAGIVRYSPGDDLARLERMQRCLRHRGPDDQGMWTSPHAGLVHTRLALIDPAHGKVIWRKKFAPQRLDRQSKLTG